uniref:Large ribosomal subunit protein uL30 N-terminal eukaryotes domain-containing protein n=1 Tax=Nelumbo nucifera TaxID=4432 RepID=A0A822ZJW3_NELNU|nr:TPA_asm: hypothetical protein HUJ06_016331 [Nelumbo nucifera]
MLKKRKRSEEWALQAKKQELIFKRAMQYAKEYDEQQKELIQLKHEAKLKGGFYTKKILKLLRLGPIFNGVSLKVNKATILNMLHRRGYGKLNKQRIALNDDSIIEQANNFLWPFKLKSPLDGGGDARIHEDYINELIKRMKHPQKVILTLLHNNQVQN